MDKWYDDLELKIIMWVGTVLLMIVMVVFCLIFLDAVFGTSFTNLTYSPGSNQACVCAKEDR